MTTLFYAKRTILFFVSTGTRVTTRRILIENHNCKINFCGRQTTYNICMDIRFRNWVNRFKF